MTALEDNKEGLTECAKRRGNYVTVPKPVADKIKSEAEEIKKQKNRRLTETRRNAEEKLRIKESEWL